MSLAALPAAPGAPIPAGGAPPLLEWGYILIEAVQQHRTPAGDIFFIALSFLGEEIFYLLLVPLLYWLLDKRLATHFSILFLFSAYLNLFLKDLVMQPRPSPERVAVMLDAPAGGMPSGHAQNALVSWGYLATVIRRGWFRAAMLLLILGISFSRLYLGVHFPHDTLSGWAIAFVILGGYLLLAPGAYAALQGLSTAGQMAAGGGAALLLLLAFPVDTSLASAATLMGLAVGVPWERARVRFAARGGSVAQLLLRLLLGLVVALLIWRGLRPILLPLGVPGTGLRYLLLGLWVSAGAPWLFVRLRLASVEPPGLGAVAADPLVSGRR